MNRLIGLFLFFSVGLKSSSIQLPDIGTVDIETYKLVAPLDNLFKKDLNFIVKNIDANGLCDLLNKEGFLPDVQKYALAYAWFNNLWSYYFPTFNNPVLQDLDTLVYSNFLSEVVFTNNGYKILGYKNQRDVDYNMCLFDKDNKALFDDVAEEFKDFNLIKAFLNKDSLSILTLPRRQLDNRVEAEFYHIFLDLNRNDINVDDIEFNFVTDFRGLHVLTLYEIKNFDFLDKDRMIFVEYSYFQKNFLIYLYFNGRLHEFDLVKQLNTDIDKVIDKPLDQIVPEIIIGDKNNFMVKFADDLLFVFIINEQENKLKYEFLEDVSSAAYLEDGSVVAFYENGDIEILNWQEESKLKVQVESGDSFKDYQDQIVALKNNDFAIFKNNEIVIFDSSIEVKVIKKIKAAYPIKFITSNIAKDSIIAVSSDDIGNSYIQEFTLHGVQKEFLTFNNSIIQKLGPQIDGSLLIWLKYNLLEDKIVKFTPLTDQSFRKFLKADKNVSVDELCRYAHFYEFQENIFKKGIEVSAAKRRAVSS